VKAADPRLLFILTEIELGITFVQRALTAYQLGYEEHGHSAKANAIKALESAKRFIGDLDPEDQQIARAELPKLEQALTTFPSSVGRDFS
jgi:hypothetical protein